MTVMTIEKATDFTLHALTLKEKSLARDLLYNEQYDKKVLTTWQRAPLLKLGDALAKSRKEADARGFKAKFFNFYCDTLIIEEETQITPDTEDGRPVFFNLGIFARKIVHSAGLAFHVQFVEESEVTFWAPQLSSSPIEFSFEDGYGQKGIRQLSVEPGCSGVSVFYGEEGLEDNHFPAPDTAMENINYMELIQEDGTLKDRGYRNDDLPRLIQFLMLVAEAHATLDRTFAIQLLDFIIAMTGNDRAFQLNYQACSLRSGLTVQMDTMNVPSVNIYASKQILKSRLVAALAFEQAFRDFLLEAGNRAIQKETAFNMLARSQDAMKTYDFLHYIKKREFDNAVTANDKACKTFNDAQTELEKLSKKFEEGIEKYKWDQEKKAIKGVFKGIFQVGVAIGVAVATGGLGTGAVIDSVGKLVNAATKPDGLFAKLGKVFEELNKIYKKIKPVLEKLKKIGTTITGVIDAIKKVNKKTQRAKTLKPDLQSVDVFNATADWRRFDVVVRDMEEALYSFKGISGKDEYFQALKKMVVTGETYIQTQANLVQKGDEYSTVLMQQAMGELDESRLAAAAKRVGTDEAVLNILMRSMFDRVLAIRHQVYFDFQTYSDAYHYFTLSQKSVVLLSPVKPITDYLDDMARLRGAIAVYSSKTIVQQRPFKMKTLGSFPNSEALANAISAGQPISFDITQDEDLWDGFSRIRLSCTRCWLDGVNTPSDLPLRLELRSDTQFFDHNYESEDIAAVSLIKRYVGDARKVLFEYKPSSKSISCDGIYGQERDYTKYTPMTKWSIQVIGNGVDTVAPKDIDFSGFEGITMEFVCDFTWVGAQ